MKKNINDEFNNFTEIPISSNYLISKFGIIFRKDLNSFLIPTYRKINNFYHVKLNNNQHQIKNLLYITFIDRTIDYNIISTPIYQLLILQSMN